LIHGPANEAAFQDFLGYLDIGYPENKRRGDEDAEQDW
jgi:hypothetical protein